MTSTNEATIRRFLDAWGDGQSDPDVEAILSMLHPEAQWQLWVPAGPTVIGHAAIARDIRRQLTWCTKMLCGLVHLTSSGTTVMTERVDTFEVNGTRLEHHLMAVFDVDDAGLITGWREYFDYAELDRRLKAVAAVIPKVEST